MDQYYIADADNVAVRCRVSTESDGSVSAMLAIKGANSGISRLEIEKHLSLDEANSLKLLAISCLSKTRYRIDCGGSIWDFDVFNGELDGTVYAEIEVENEQSSFKMISCDGMQLVDGRDHSNAYLASTLSQPTKP